jgi:hypothetical protein
MTFVFGASKLFAVRCLVFSVQCIVFAVQCLVFAVQCLVFAVQCLVFAHVFQQTSKGHKFLHVLAKLFSLFAH